jgi:hypothetical protein
LGGTPSGDSRELERCGGIRELVALEDKFALPIANGGRMGICGSRWKSWSRFDQFLEILLTFGFGEEGKEDETLIGLEFYMNIRFVERVCDFILGKKSPLCMPNEKRIEMGGSFSQPNFTPLIKMLTKILTNQELLDKYPLSDLEKKMFLDAELLKILLSNQSGGK